MTKIQSPSAYGLPEKFVSWRPQQEEGLDLLARSTTRVDAFSMPGGSGKSPMYMGHVIKSGKPTAIVTDSRAMQDQLMEDFSGSGLVDLRGRANYDCLARAGDPSYTCEQGYAAACPYKGKPACPASFAEMRAACSMLVTTNYSKWIHNRKFGQGLSHIEQVVFDEGHEAPNALAKAMQVVLHHKEIEEVLEVNFPDSAEAHFFKYWKLWAAEVKVRCEDLMKRALAKMNETSQPRPSTVKLYTHLRNLARRLAILSTANPNNWIVEEVPNVGYQFDPISPARYAESSLLLGVPKIIVVSATLRPKTLYMMGIKTEFFTFKEFPSDFDPSRCPTYYIPTMYVDNKASSLKPLWTLLDQFAGRRRDRNGLVQTVSYTRRDEVLASSRFAPSMTVNPRGEPATSTVNDFKKRYPGEILVSPSIGQGFDFRFKAAEWQLLCKMPLPPPSRIMKARTELDHEYPYYIAWQKMAQSACRVMRDHKDQGETLIGDRNLEWMRSRYGHLAPKSFWQFFRPISTLPQPPPRLV